MREGVLGWLHPGHKLWLTTILTTTHICHISYTGLFWCLKNLNVRHSHNEWMLKRFSSCIITWKTSFICSGLFESRHHFCKFRLPYISMFPNKDGKPNKPTNTEKDMSLWWLWQNRRPPLASTLSLNNPRRQADLADPCRPSDISLPSLLPLQK